MVAEWLRVARLRRTVFLVVMLLLAATLGWLGWRLLAQDEQLASQRLADDRDVAADLLTASVERRLSLVEHGVDGLLPPFAGATVPPDEGAILVQLRPDSVRAWPERRLLYYPELPGESEPSARAFAIADDLEFGKGDSRAAIAVLAADAESTDPRVKAAARVRTARNFLKNDQNAEAVHAYDKLGRLGDVRVGSIPAALAAHVGRLAVFERQKNAAALASSARALLQALRSGEWPVSYATYQYLDREAGRWATERDRHSPRQLVLAEALTWLWDTWMAHDLPARGRATVMLSSGPALVVWRLSADEAAAFVADSEHIERV